MMTDAIITDADAMTLPSADAQKSSTNRVLPSPVRRSSTNDHLQ